MEEKNCYVEHTDDDDETRVDGCSGALLAPLKCNPYGTGDRHDKRRHKFREVRRIRSKKEILWEEGQSRTRRDQQHQSACFEREIPARERHS